MKYWKLSKRNIGFIAVIGFFGDIIDWPRHLCRPNDIYGWSKISKMEVGTSEHLWLSAVTRALYVPCTRNGQDHFLLFVFSHTTQLTNLCRQSHNLSVRIKYTQPKMVNPLWLEGTEYFWTEFTKSKNLLSPPLAGPVPSEAKTSCKSCTRIRNRVPSIIWLDMQPWNPARPASSRQAPERSPGLARWASDELIREGPPRDFQAGCQALSHTQMGSDLPSIKQKCHEYEKSKVS